MDGHAAVLDSQGTLAVAGFIGVEHAAVGVELRRIDTVRQRGSGFLSCRGLFLSGSLGRFLFGGRSRFFLGCGLCGFRVDGGFLFLCTAGQQREQQQSGQQQGEISLHSVSSIERSSLRSGSRRSGALHESIDYAFRASMAALVWAT